MSEQWAYEGIVVLGAPRSGTTLLRRLLNAHPDIHCPPETNLLNAASRFLEEHRFAGNLSVGVVPGLDFSGLDETTILQRLREFVFSFFRDIRDRSGKSIWAEKTAFDTFHLDAIERICAGHCRFICLTRHGLDVCCSTKQLTDKMGMYLPELHEYVKRYPAPLEAFAHAWVNVNQRLNTFMETNRADCALFKYEDLVVAPEDVLSRIFAFLDRPVDVDEVLRCALSATDSAGLGDWKTYKTRSIESGSVDQWKNLPTDVIDRLAQITNPTLELLGYETVEVRGAGERAADSKRQEELSRMVAKMSMQMGKSDSK